MKDNEIEILIETIHNETFNKPRVERNSPNLIKANYENPIVTLIIVKIRSILFKINGKRNMLTIVASVQQCAECPASLKR